MKRHRLLSFDLNRDLSNLFDENSHQRNNPSSSAMNNNAPNPQVEMQSVLARIEQQMNGLIAQNTALNQKLTELEGSQATLQQQNETLQQQNASLQLQTTTLQQQTTTLQQQSTQSNAVVVTEYEDITPIYPNGDAIQLDAFKVIPEFDGNRKLYRAWRSQVQKLMSQIDNHKAHPKYAAALSIIRAKITRGASDILINNNTAHNINAIIDRLDFSYSDQRPLYVIEAELTTMQQNGKTLQEFYDDVNQALNMVLTKIAMTYKTSAEQKSLGAETQAKAIRTFVTGLNSAMVRTTLYGTMPKTLSEAFAIAQTIQYDNQYLRLEMGKPVQPPNSAPKKLNYHPNFQYQSQPTNHTPKQNLNQNFVAIPQQHHPPKPTPMEVDMSKQYVQQNNWQAEKRQREQSFQNVNKRLPSFQHLTKQQRVNNVEQADEILSVQEYSMENNDDGEAHEIQSAASETKSVFLEE